MKKNIKGVIPTSGKVRRKDVEFFTEKVFEKIDGEDSRQNQFWTEIIIRTIKD